MVASVGRVVLGFLIVVSLNEVFCTRSLLLVSMIERQTMELENRGGVEGELTLRINHASSTQDIKLAAHVRTRGHASTDRERFPNNIWSMY